MKLIIRDVVALIGDGANVIVVANVLKIFGIAFVVLKVI